ncbi:MAG: hypothetical protein IJQ99_10030 [Synergistaceae bacterium]|nr:hypothetical protein [Synergistaceae bacterium]MBR0317193.1 hypothetical protein [Synergistaceae bacterium]
MYERQKEFPDSPLFNMYPLLMKLYDWVDMKKMSETIIKTAQVHPACFSVIEEHNGVPFQKYIPDLITDVKIEKISDAEFQSMINTFVQPFKPDDAPFRFRLFETEKAKYFFFDTYHVFCDAFAKAIFLYDLDKVYAGKELERDGWFSYLEERERAKNLPHYQESRLYYENLYGNTEWSRYPKIDFSDERENTQGLLFREVDFCQSDLEILKNYHLTYNEFFSAISLLSTAIFNNSENVINTWTYKGRWKKSHHNIVGNMILDMPVALNLQNLTVNQIFESVREQLKGSLLHRDYSYTMLDEKILRDDILCFIYHGNLYDVPAKINLFESMVIDFNDFSKGSGTSDNIIDVELRQDDDKLLFLTDYAANKYKPETIEKFADIFLDLTNKLLKLMNENKCASEVLF